MFASDLLKVRYCPQYLPRERIVERVASLGYRASEYTGSTAPADAERKDLLLRIGIAAFLSMNVMTFSLVIYASYFEPITASFGRYIPFVLMALATPAVFYCAAPILRIAWAGARAGRAAHGIAARHGNPAGLRLQRGAGLPRRQPRLLRHRLRHRDAGARRQSHRARRQGARPRARSRCSTA